MKRLLVTLTIVAAVLGAACSKDKKDDAASSTTVTAVDATVTTAAPGSTLPPPPKTCSTDILRGTSSPPPQQGAALADGQYFGFVTELDAEDLKVKFDVAQLLTGAAATKAAAEDGGESPPPNDYWIRNNTKAARTLALADDATICLPTADDVTKNTPSDLEHFNKVMGDGEPRPMWVDVRNGTAVRVEQQYFP